MFSGFLEVKEKENEAYVIFEKDNIWQYSKIYEDIKPQIR